MINRGVGNSVDWTKMYDPIVAFVPNPKGLMTDASLKGGQIHSDSSQVIFFIPVKTRGAPSRLSWITPPQIYTIETMLRYETVNQS